VLPDRLGQTGHQAQQDLKEQQDLKVQLVIQELQAQSDLLALQAQQDLKVILAIKVFREVQVPRANQE